MEESWQYVALLGAVIVIAALLMPRNKNDMKSASPDAQLEQLELAFEQFMENTEKEHQDLVHMLTEALQKLREEDRLKSEQISQLQLRQAQSEEQLSRLAQQLAAAEAKLQMLGLSSEGKATESIAKAIPNIQLAKPDESHKEAALEVSPNFENTIHARFPELFELYHAGKSIDTIAKKLGKNKGEVQLIIQLALQEEKANHA